MKYLLISFISLLSLNIYAQEDKTVTLVVFGQGATQEEARQKALRGAIEQAFGTFISSKTEILNDNLVKDEIVSVANGNIQKFDIISETLLPNNTYASTLNATISISKLTSFCQSKGINSEFKGGLFAMNIAMQELNQKNEIQAWKNLNYIIDEVIKKSIDYKIIASEPIRDGEKWGVPLKIEINFNNNFEFIRAQIYEFCKSISLNADKVSDYEKQKSPVYAIKFNNPSDGNTYYLRNKTVVNEILSLPWRILKFCLSNILYDDGLKKENLFTPIFYPQNFNITDLAFRKALIEPSIVCNNCPEYHGRDLTLFYTVHKYQGDAVSNYNQLRYQIIAENEGRMPIGNKFIKFNKLGFIDTPDISEKGNSDNSYFDAENYFDDVDPEYKRVYKFNIYNLNQFIAIDFIENLNIEEMKKITEYKVTLNNFN